MNAIILCGGRSARMGRDKAFIRINGKTLVERQIELLGGRFEKIILVRSDRGDGDKLAAIKARGRVEVVSDILPCLGPLGGLYTGLKSSDSRYNFTVAVDMPFISPGLADYLAGGIKKGFQAVVPYYRGKYQPLCALYSRDCLGRIYEALAGNKLKLARLLIQFKVRKVRKEELARFGNPDIFFRNINTPQDLQYVCRCRNKHGVHQTARF